MEHIKKLSYPNTSQRRLVCFNTAISCILAGFICTEIAMQLNYYFIYQPVFRIIIVCFACFTIGKLLSRIVYTRKKSARIVYASSEVLFIACAGLYFGYRMFAAQPLTASGIIVHPFAIVFGYLMLFAGVTGIKIEYFHKISCGEFIDEKNGEIPFLANMLMGLFVGIGLSAGLNASAYSGHGILLAVLLLVLFPMPWLIRLSYHPISVYAREMGEGNATLDKIHYENKKDTILINVINVISIAIYIHLAYVTILKHYGDIIQNKLYFSLMLCAALVIGICITQLFKKKFIHVFLLPFLPVIFISFLLIFRHYNGILTTGWGISLIIVPGIVYGAIINNTIQNIQANYDHVRAFKLIDFLIFIVPLPIFTAISFVDFTYFWFFIFLYLLCLINVFLPGFLLFQQKSGLPLKIGYSLYAVMLVPSIVIMHLYFSIPLNRQLYCPRVDRYDLITQLNYSADFIRQKGTVRINTIPAFTVSDSALHNIKRAICAINLYKTSDAQPVLYLDGNYKFFRHSFFSSFKNIVALDYVPDRMVQYRKPPLFTAQTMVPDSDDLLLYLDRLRRNNTRFSLIVDFPNQFDQRNNPFHFSAEYITLNRQLLQQDGLYVAIIDLFAIRNAYFRSLMMALLQNYRHHTGFLFSNYMVIFSGNKKDSLEISEEKISAIRQLFKEKSETAAIFYNEFHLLSRLLFADSAQAGRFMTIKPANQVKGLAAIPALVINKNKMLEQYFSAHGAFISCIPDNGSPKAYYVKKAIENEITKDGPVHALLKKVEYADAIEDYEQESAGFFELKKFIEYRPELRAYLFKILAHKEDYYFQSARKLERNKEWIKAKRLYKAILNINKDNFEVNYRMGILCITLQELDDSFKYLQHSMELKKDNPKVLFQMGVLLFSSGRAKDAIGYLQKSESLKENTPGLYLYLGLCHEELGNFQEAKRLFQKAQIRDLNDSNIKSSLERIEAKIEMEKNRWQLPARKNQIEAEKGEKIPLPINEAAVSKRLSDEEANRMGKSSGDDPNDW